LGDGHGGFNFPNFIHFTPPPRADGFCPNLGAAIKVGNDTSIDIVATATAFRTPWSPKP
jgi:hypothetical protein